MVASGAVLDFLGGFCSSVDTREHSSHGHGEGKGHVLGGKPGPSFDFPEDGHHSVMFLSLCYHSVRLFDAVDEASLSRMHNRHGLAGQPCIVVTIDRGERANYP
jgi:hypothetical protein